MGDSPVHHTLQKYPILIVELAKMLLVWLLITGTSPLISKKKTTIIKVLGIKRKKLWGKRQTVHLGKIRCGLMTRILPFKGNRNVQMLLSTLFLSFKEKYFIDRYLSLSILMSKGPSFCREKPLSGVSNCIEEQPASKRTPSRVPGSTPEEINKASALLNCPRRGWICFLWENNK